MVLQTQFYSHCAFETLYLEKYFLFKHIDALQSNVFTYGASDAILFSVSIEIPNLENYLY